MFYVITVEVKIGHSFKRRKGVPVDPSQLCPHPEHLVIPNKYVNRTACEPSPLANIENEVEHFAVLVTPTDEVSELNYRQASANPVPVLVYASSQTKSMTRSVEIGVNVSDSDEPSHLRLGGSRIGS